MTPKEAVDLFEAFLNENEELKEMRAGMVFAVIDKELSEMGILIGGPDIGHPCYDNMVIRIGNHICQIRGVEHAPYTDVRTQEDVIPASHNWPIGGSH